MKLKDYNQEQLLKYYDELTDEEKESLTKQIDLLDLDSVNKVYQNSYTDDVIDVNKIKPLKIIDKRIYDDNSKGEELLKNNQYAVLLLAGGFGSRLGIDKPKGCLELNINNKKISLFELFINQLKEANKKYGSSIRLYIMTSTTNNKDTISFFKDHNYFDYKDNIVIFTQDDYPILDVNGKILLKSKHEILMGPNGNGDVFNALKRNNLIEDMDKHNIEYVLFTAIDNPLTNLVDIDFITATIDNNYKIASKTITKKDKEDKAWIFCKYNDKPYMLPTEFITDELTNTKLDNDYIYREKNITYHLLSIDNIKKFADIDLRYHRAYKNNKYLDDDGNLIESDEKNSFKFEKYIFDAFYYGDDMLLYRIDEDEFSPIKEKEDIEKTTELLQKKMS